MTTTETPAAGATTPTEVHPPARKGNPWIPTPRGVALVTRIELLRRRPSRKGYIMFAILFAAVIALAVVAAVKADDGLNSILMELVLVLVLGIGLLVAPSLSATSLNGDSSEGVLAPMQMTHLTAGDLAVGKLIASWLFAVAILVTTTPLLWYAFTRSGWHGGELAVVLLAILFTVLVFTAVGLAWSAIAARAVASVSLAHLTTGFLALGTLLVFAFSMPLVSENVPYTYRYFDYDNMTEEQQAQLDEGYNAGDFTGIDLTAFPCVEETSETPMAHTERTAWLLLINPVVVIGELSPIVNPSTYEQDGRAAPGMFAQMHQWVSEARIGPDTTPVVDDGCVDPFGESVNSDWQQQQEEQATYSRAPWLGLGIQALILIGSMAIVVQRLRVPYKKLRSGTRVA